MDFHFSYRGRIQDFKLGGALKKIAPSWGRRENFWGISCEKSRFYAKNIFSNFRGCAPPWIRPCISQTAEDTATYVILVIWEWVWVTLLAMQYMKRCIILRSEIMNKVGGTDFSWEAPVWSLPHTNKGTSRQEEEHSMLVKGR